MTKVAASDAESFKAPFDVHAVRNRLAPAVRSPLLVASAPALPRRCGNDFSGFEQAQAQA